MADTVSAVVLAKLVVTKTLDLSLDNASNPPTTINIGTTNDTIDASTTVPATKEWSDTRALAAGSDALDLTASTNQRSETTTFSGLKVQRVYITCPSTNTAGVTFVTAAANGYNLFGADNASAEQVEVMPGGFHLSGASNNLEDCDATHKAITVTGTGTDAYSIHLVAG